MLFYLDFPHSVASSTYCSTWTFRTLQPPGSAGWLGQPGPAGSSAGHLLLSSACQLFSSQFLPFQAKKIAKNINLSRTLSFCEFCNYGFREKFLLFVKIYGKQFIDLQKLLGLFDYNTYKKIIFDPKYTFQQILGFFSFNYILFIYIFRSVFLFSPIKISIPKFCSPKYCEIFSLLVASKIWPHFEGKFCQINVKTSLNFDI